MRDVVKTNVKREQNRKRKKRRKRHTMLYFFLVMMIFAGVGILLSVTLFFNVKNITVKGVVDYTNESVIMTSGIGNGDNLLRLDSKKASENILSSMIYVETAVIDKQYPETVVINVTGCVPTAYAEYGGGYLTLSAKGKILENTKDNAGDLPVIKGIETNGGDPGKYLTSADEQKMEIVEKFLQVCSNMENNKITEIDITDKYDISTVYDNRIIFKMGNSNDMAYKLNLAETVFESINNGKSGVMTMVGANQISFREKAGSGSGTSVTDNKKKIPITDRNTSPTKPEGESDEQYGNAQEGGYEDYNSSSEDDYSYWEENNSSSSEYGEYSEENYGEQYNGGYDENNSYDSAGNNENAENSDNVDYGQENYGENGGEDYYE